MVVALLADLRGPAFFVSWVPLEFGHLIVLEVNVSGRVSDKQQVLELSVVQLDLLNLDDMVTMAVFESELLWQIVLLLVLNCLFHFLLDRCTDDVVLVHCLVKNAE